MPKIIVVGSLDNVSIDFTFSFAIQVKIGTPTFLCAITHQGNCCSFKSERSFGSGSIARFPCSESVCVPVMFF